MGKFNLDKGFVPFYKVKTCRSEIDRMDDDIFVWNVKEELKMIERKVERKFREDAGARYCGHVLSILEDARLAVAKAFANADYGSEY